MNAQDPTADWVAVLDRLEEHVALTERAVADQVVPATQTWVPPADMAPMPDIFLARARNLLARQQALIDVIPSMISSTNEQRRVLHRIGDATGSATSPVYLDIAT